MIYNGRIQYTKCTECPYEDKNKVFGSGNINGKYIFMGECPGVDEECDGIPFIGKAGQALRLVLKEIGILDDAWFTNYVICRPPNNNFQDVGMNIATKLCLNGLMVELDYLHDNHFTHLFVLGNNACSAFNLKGISSIKGRVYELRDVQTNFYLKLIPNFHPSYIIRRGGKGNKLLWEDWKNTFISGINE